MRNLLLLLLVEARGYEDYGVYRCEVKHVELNGNDVTDLFAETIQNGVSTDSITLYDDIRWKQKIGRFEQHFQVEIQVQVSEGQLLYQGVDISNYLNEEDLASIL